MAETRPIQQMNAEALDTVYRAYRDEMTAVAARLLRNRSIPEAMIGPEDVVHTAFERALGAQDQLRKPRAYLYTTLRREVIYQGERQHQAREWAAEHTVEERNATRHGQDVASMVAERMLVWNALRELPLRQRTALVANKMYGLTQSEIAQMEKRHPGTVAVAVARAAATLRRSTMNLMPSTSGGFFIHPLVELLLAAKVGASKSQGDRRIEFIALSLELETALETALERKPASPRPVVDA